MKRSRHTPEQVIRKLREADRLLAEGKTVEEVARHLEISEQTYHRWRAQYGGMKADDAKRLRELERENSRAAVVMLREGSGLPNAGHVGSSVSTGRHNASRSQSSMMKSNDCGRGCEHSRHGAPGGVGAAPMRRHDEKDGT